VARTESTDDDEWDVPSSNYTKRYSLSDGGSLAIVFIDTTTLAPEENECCNEDGGISTTLQAKRIYNQMANVERMLYEARYGNPATYVVVAGHYPIVSGGDHGDCDSLVYGASVASDAPSLLSLLTEYEVDMYFAGHDHFSQHLQYSGIDFFICGGGAMIDDKNVSTMADVRWTGVGYSAFCRMKMTKEAATLQYIDM
jgi:hypothetical protein